MSEETESPKTETTQPVAAAATGSAGSKECAMHAAIAGGINKGEIYQCRKAAVAEYPEGRAHVSYRPVCSFHAKMLKRRGVEVRPLPNATAQQPAPDQARDEK